MNLYTHCFQNLHIAYLDGGTGSMMLQAALAGVLTAAYALKGSWYSIKARIAKPEVNKSK